MLSGGATLWRAAASCEEWRPRLGDTKSEGTGNRGCRVSADLHSFGRWNVFELFSLTYSCVTCFMTVSLVVVLFAGSIEKIILISEFHSYLSLKFYQSLSGSNAKECTLDHKFYMLVQKVINIFAGHLYILHLVQVFIDF